MRSSSAGEQMTSRLSSKNHSLTATSNPVRTRPTTNLQPWSIPHLQTDSRSRVQGARGKRWWLFPLGSTHHFSASPLPPLPSTPDLALAGNMTPPINPAERRMGVVALSPLFQFSSFISSKPHPTVRPTYLNCVVKFQSLPG
jgi:hypothetical protein